MKKLLTLVFILPFFVCSQNVETMFLGFYETGATLENYNIEDQLRTEFSKQKARYIGTYVKLYNNDYNVKDQNFKIKLSYFDSAVKKFGETEINVSLSKNTKMKGFYRGFGYKDPNLWKADTFSVVATIDGKVVGSSSFKIVNRSTSISKVISMKFFEWSGTGTPPKDRTHSQRFKSDTARFIYTDVNIDNPNYNKFEWRAKMTLKYYYPDGSLLLAPEIDMKIPITYKGAILYHGASVAKDYTWPKGNYRVEAWHDGKLMSTNFFTME
ncbi:hypothetical protein [Winogradskyella sp. 3972H.M.0a.05]|uniref:hypothetical protein n=1 Tax=Winogradskyella sp. 3972H.M.0a.05 TaxID=2950277 RepID=UPI00339B0B9D